MQRKAIALILTAIFLSVTPAVYAERGSDDSQNKPHKENQAKQEFKEQREAFKDVMRENREEIKQKIEQYKSERKDFMSSISAERKAALEANKEAFRAKLAAMQDERKKLTAEKVDAKLAAVNTKQTDKMSQGVVKLQEILNKLIDRTNAAKTAGADTAATETAINNAKAAISTAEAAIAAQKAKTYTANVTDETSLGKAFSTTFAQLRTDLGTTHETVKAAKKALKQVAIELLKVKVSTTVTPTP